VLLLLLLRRLVLHRGVGVANAKGLYFWEKIDLAIDYTLLSPLRAVFNALSPREVGIQPCRVLNDLDAASRLAGQRQLACC
jgi:hypothetical protein